MKTFLITGVTGFLGSHLAQALLARGDKVIGMGRRKKGLLSDALLNNKNFLFLNADIMGNTNELLKAYPIEGLFHLASQKPLESQAPPLTYQDFYRGNVETTLKMIEFAKQKKVKVLCYTSTNSVFGKRPEGKYIDEDSSPTPTSHYGLTKYIAERLLEIELKDADTKVRVVRFSSLFGRGYKGGLVFTYYQLATRAKNIEVYHQGKRYRNILHVNDAVDILIKAAGYRKGKKFEVFMAGSPNSLRMREIAASIKKLTRSDSPITFVKGHTSTDWDVFINISKAQKILKFAPMTSKESLTRYIKEKAYDKKTNHLL